MNIYFFVFFPLSFKKCNKLFPKKNKKCNKLDEYIYTYFFIIPIIPLNNFFYNKIVVIVIKKKNLDYIFLLYCITGGVVEIDNHN